MVAFFTVVHVLLCVFMIFVILLQPGKDAGMGAALGGGAATSAFGGRGAVTFLSKLTAVCAGLFFLTSLGLSFVGVRASVTSSVAAKAAAKPAAPVAPAPGDAAAPAAAPKASDAEPAPAAPVPAPAPAQK
ncbi:MAG TPA: preprotein translocase subunit SecG [Myxococcaceae bacterium]|nr:preprotein translocase subunit SecG [Myxococcaceae bacterium]